jgi:hypothetical protein
MKGAAHASKNIILRTIRNEPSVLYSALLCSDLQVTATPTRKASTAHNNHPNDDDDDDDDDNNNNNNTQMDPGMFKNTLLSYKQVLANFKDNGITFFGYGINSEPDIYIYIYTHICIYIICIYIYTHIYLAGWVGWLVGLEGLAGWLGWAGWLVVWVGWMAGWLVGWLGWLDGWLAGLG